ncbi:MAG: DegT/DnrJ/EryC1/StrS family aminotransferase, partial [Armatimonadetes bacterium]|nr:DegT/DnrJ/EryC1/StrS family aminotransferase [Armatimonadota bacterium]
MRVPLIDLPAEYASLREEILSAVDEVLQGMRLYLGPRTEELEQRWADFVGVKHAVAVASGTDSLTLPLLAAGIGPGDEVITVGWTFIATLEAILHTGARPVVVDVEPEALTMDVEQLRAAVTPRTRALLPVHIYGHPADMGPIMQIAAEHDLFVLEDAAQAHGAQYQGQPVGSLGHAGSFSFYVTKNLSAYGEGGIVTTNDDDLAAQIRLLRNHGRSEKAEHVVVGFNSRLHELQAAILLVKLKYFPQWNERRRQIAAYYNDRLADLPLSLPVEREGCRHAYHIYGTRTTERDRLKQAFEQADIGYSL